MSFQVVLRQRLVSTSLFFLRFKSTKSISSSGYCLDLIKKYDYENFLCTLLLPQSMRNAAIAIRAFNVEIANAAVSSNDPRIARMRLKFWEETLERIYDKNPPHQPVAIELARVISSHDLKKRQFLRLINARANHLEEPYFPTLEKMEFYSEESISPVLYLILEASGIKNVNADHAASHIGKAGGLCLLLRVTGSKGGSWALPKDLLEAAGLDPQLGLTKGSELSRDVVHKIASRAKAHLDKARSLKSSLPKESTVHLLPAIPTGSYLSRLRVIMNCIDMHKHSIAPGLHFVPGPDSCTLCVCDNGNPKWCKAVLCSPPQNCKSFRVGNACCDFICLDDTLGKSDGDHDFNAELGLRLIATAITAILSLSLLFFLLHRLRQRKIRGRQDRELTEEERSLGSIGYIAGSLGYLPPHHFEETAAGYPLWKPAYYSAASRSEAPPPYEEALAAARAEAALARLPGPSITSQMTAQHRTIPANLATSSSLLPGHSDPSGFLPSESTGSKSMPDCRGVLSGATPGPSNEPTSGVVEPLVVGGVVSRTGPAQPTPVGGAAVVSSGVGVVGGAPAGGGVGVGVGGGEESGDDYRSECENCQMRQTPAYEDDLVTMTLHRRTADSGDLHFYSRTSLTLPTHPRKQQLRERCGATALQSGVAISCARENWFSSMPESSSSEEEEVEDTAAVD